ncbi:hypothetical protein FCH79_08140 [Pseudomonas koreensis]|uniref:hypothetical protein n=1 Tax=Pseudomonas koreensis TaxID=198620 RepID=UPI0015764137|nr:hypothetical protein [Pseudomonas koreensis]NTZ95292.1 hypothetical protein [Pseudomonas koreensis]
MKFFELDPADISSLTDSDLRELVARLCEAELSRQEIQPSCVFWGGAQEAPDGGLDVYVREAGSLTKPGFVVRGNTGFQVKKNSMSKAACKKEMLYKGQQKDIIKSLVGKNGAYIIVSGKDDCTNKMLSERVAGMKAALVDLADKDNLVVDFYGRDRLAAWLRQHPGVGLWVRSKLGKQLSGWFPFGRWTSAPVDSDEFLQDEHPCILDKSTSMADPVSLLDGINLVRKKLRDAGSVVRITGLSGVGKTRFAQALFESGVGKDVIPSTDVIYADLGDELYPSASELVSYLIANNFCAYVVLDNCPPDVHRRLQKLISKRGIKLSLLTIEYDISDDHPEETMVFHIEPSSEENVSKLVQKRFPNLGSPNAHKISEFAGGNARIALALADRVKAGETLSNFTDEELFYRLFTQRKQSNEYLMEHAAILSLVYSFNVDSALLNDELTVLAAIGGASRRELYKSHAELLRRQLSQKRGGWRAVLPHALANRLAKRALENVSVGEINSELFRSENLRLFVSCAHRIGYLHDIDLAHNLAVSWVSPGGPLQDVAACNDEQLQALEYVAPVFPAVVLNAIELASCEKCFASRDNKSFSRFVSLLCKIAYDEDLFDRAVQVILKFAESEKASENNNSVVGRLEQLFSLYLSGTNASPSLRQGVAGRLIVSSDPRHREIAEKLFDSAFKVSNWTSSANFDFGARTRTYGWIPVTNGDGQAWYRGFIKQLYPCLAAADKKLQSLAKTLIARHFMGLWSFAGCIEELEEVIAKYGAKGKWTEIWRSIQRTIKFCGENFGGEILVRLRTLEKLTAPVGVKAEIEAYALTNTWDQSESFSGSYSARVDSIHERVVSLGFRVASDYKLLESIGDKLWCKQIDSLRLFGKGLARGSSDPFEMFEYLWQLMRDQKQEPIELGLFAGFINEVYSTDTECAQLILQCVLQEPELLSYFIFLLCASPIDDWGIQKLILLADSTKVDAWHFRQLGHGQAHSNISDSDLCRILISINRLESGALTSLYILGMRFFAEKGNSYSPTDELVAIGTDSLYILLTMHRNDIRGLSSHDIDLVLPVCLSVSVVTTKVVEIIDVLYEGLTSYRLYSFEILNIIETVVKNFPELLLDRIFRQDKPVEQAVHVFFKDRITREASPLNSVPVHRLIDWCDKDEQKLQFIASALTVYLPVADSPHNIDSPKGFLIGEQALAVLAAAANKAGIIEVFFEKIYPGSWTNSLADVLELRAKAFSALLDFPMVEVRAVVEEKNILAGKLIKAQREKEASQDLTREQRFE